MMGIISILNGISVGIFGMVLSASFCNINWTHQKRIFMLFVTTVILIFQGGIYFTVDYNTVRYLYPLITHLPLALVLVFLSKDIFEGINAVFMAYLCCQLRRWIALLVVVIVNGTQITQNVSELIITIPLLIFLIKFVSKSVRSISQYMFSIKWQFIIIPVLYYLFDYVTQIYTKLLLRGTPIIVEFMPFVCSVAYLVFILYFSHERWTRNLLEKTQECLNLQIAQAVREIENLRQSQQKNREYQHDLRHHMQFISTCIENGKLEQAQNYICEIYSEVEANKVTNFCANEAANLILSAYERRIRYHNISIKITVTLSQNICISECDLCVILSNALENALNSCKKLIEKGEDTEIEVLIYEKKDKIFIQIINSCGKDVRFEDGIPVTNACGHGVGVRSICALVDRYSGIYSFSVKEGQFSLRILI